jgi:hypothetical protein
VLVASVAIAEDLVPLNIEGQRSPGVELSLTYPLPIAAIVGVRRDARPASELNWDKPRVRLGRGASGAPDEHKCSQSRNKSLKHGVIPSRL